MRIYLMIAFILLGTFCTIMTAYADPAEDDQNVEVVSKGKQYGSMDAYRREQLIQELSEVLTSQSFRLFTNDELCEVISGIRDQKSGSETPEQDMSHKNTHEAAEETEEPDTQEMEAMLQKYLQENRSAVPIELNADKVKSVLIESAPAGTTSKE